MAEQKTEAAVNLKRVPPWKRPKRPKAKTKSAKRQNTIAIRDRIIDFRRVRAGDLQPNPRNWRTHPKAQVDALRGVLSEIGYADALLARELSDGTLELVDGHARQALNPEQVVPVLVLDLNENEANKLLTVLDPLAGMAEANATALDSLLQEISTESDSVQAMLDKLADANELDSFGTLDETAMKENNPKLQAFIAAREASRTRGEDANEMNFWVCLVFQSRAQRLAFVEQLDTPILYGMYVDGETFAASIGKPVPPGPIKPFKTLVNKKLAAMTLGANPVDMVSPGAEVLV